LERGAGRSRPVKRFAILFRQVSVCAEFEPVADDLGARAELADIVIGGRFGSVVKNISADHDVRLFKDIPKPKSEIVRALPLARSVDERIGEQEIARFGIQRKQEFEGTAKLTVARSAGLESAIGAVRPRTGRWRLNLDRPGREKRARWHHMDRGNADDAKHPASRLFH
jgi:hypothetical protein